MNELFTLIHDYQKDVNRAVELLREFFKRPDVMAASREEKTRSGKFKNIEFAFHGVGCRVELEGKSVDFDFGENGRYDGFDAWRLWFYVEERPDRYPMFRDRPFLEQLIDEAARQGKIRHLNVQEDIAPHLFYLSTEK